MTSYGDMRKIRSLSCYHTELESVTAVQGDPYFVADYKQFNKTGRKDNKCVLALEIG